MRQALCMALAAHAGQPLTQEVARAIVLAVMGERRPIDTAQFAPLVLGDYTIQVERFAAVLPEMHPLHQLHWLETEGFRHGIALAPDYAACIERDETGGCLQVTLRHQGQLVGHVRMWVHARSQHTSLPMADEDTLFIRPDHRGGMLAIRLMRYAEACLLALGVREINANSKLANGAGVLMRRLGYKHVAEQFSKVFLNA